MRIVKKCLIQFSSDGATAGWLFSISSHQKVDLHISNGQQRNGSLSRWAITKRDIFPIHASYLNFDLYKHYSHRGHYLFDKEGVFSWKRNERKCLERETKDVSENATKETDFIWNNSPYGPSSACRLPGSLCRWRPIFPWPGRPVSWKLATLHFLSIVVKYAWYAV